MARPLRDRGLGVTDGSSGRNVWEGVRLLQEALARWDPYPRPGGKQSPGHLRGLEQTLWHLCCALGLTQQRQGCRDEGRGAGPLHTAQMQALHGCKRSVVSERPRLSEAQVL